MPSGPLIPLPKTSRYQNVRSVATNPPTQNHRTRLVETPLRRVDPSTPSALGGFRVREGLLQQGESHHDLLFQKSPPLPKQHLQRKSFSESSIVQRWNVDHAALPRRPDDFPPLTHTNRVVRDENANVISNRISDRLRSRSIKTRFSKSRNNVAKCRNIDFCKFTVRLYAADGGGVLVEVQRLCGDAVSFMRDCRAILNAAEGKTLGGEKGSDELDETPMFLRLPVSQMSFLKDADARLPEVTDEEQADIVNVTADLLKSRQSDTNMLGMESLVIQTDPEKTLKSMAVLASHRIICPDHDANHDFNVHNYVMSLLIYDDDCAAPSSEDSSAGSSAIHDDVSSFEDHPSRLRNLAMSALSNALGVLCNERLLEAAIGRHREWYMSVLLPRLIRDLSAADLRPHDACYASRCLSTLAGSCDDFAARLKAIGGCDAVRNAESVGVREFALLEEDAGRLYRVLNSAA